MTTTPNDPAMDPVNPNGVPPNPETDPDGLPEPDPEVQEGDDTEGTADPKSNAWGYPDLDGSKRTSDDADALEQTDPDLDTV